MLGRFLRLVTEHYPGVLTKLLIVRCPPWGPAPSPFLLGADTVAVFSGEQHKVLCYCVHVIILKDGAGYAFL